MLRKFTCLATLGALICLVAGAAARDVPLGDSGTHYTATLSYGALTPLETRGPGIGMSDFRYRGTAHAELTLVGDYLFVEGSYTRLSGEILPEIAKGIHIHHDPAMYHLDTLIGGIENEGRTEGRFEDAVRLTPEQRAMLTEGRLYMDIHTTAFPDGELRGMVVFAPDNQPVAKAP